MAGGAVRILGATKRIRGRTVLDDVTVELPRGGVYGFSGANGSGKTMLFRAVSGLIHLTSGYVEVFGQRLGRDADFPPSMGLAFDSTGFWGECTGRQNLELLASIRRVAGAEEIERALLRVGLDPQDTRPFSAYSLGMGQRLLIAQAVMESPDLLILDEPTNTLDVDGIDLVLKLVCEERARGATVLVSCHNMPELEALCDRRYLMAEGRLVGEVGDGI